MKSSESATGLEPTATSLESTSAHRAWNAKHLGWRLTSDLVASASAGALVAPIITGIDKAIMENASGRDTFKSSIKTSLRQVKLRPQTFVFSKPFGLIFMLYGGTYLTANVLDTASSTVNNKPSTTVTAGPMKFAASSSANLGICLFKDRVFVRLFGPTGPPRPVPFPSFMLFAARDCMTIFASFNIPPMLGPVLDKKMGEELKKTFSGQTVAQFMAPASVQLISTPFHLLGLDLYNRGAGISWGSRWEQIKKNWGISAAARICRIVPAFGVGGVLNAKVRRGLIESS